MTSCGWNVEYASVGSSVGVPGEPGPAPVTVKLRAADHAPCSKAPFTACTRQKYVPFDSPLTVSCVWPLVEFCKLTVENAEDVLTCQLYATMPVGSLTADHEIVHG